MARKANGQGHTYKVGSSYRTVIRQGGLVVTAMAKTAQLSKSRAKLKLSELPTKQQLKFDYSQATVSEYLLNWLDQIHKHQIAPSTYRRYRSLAIHHIIPTLGTEKLRNVNPKMISNLLVEMNSKGQSIRSQQQARALLGVAFREAEASNLISANPINKVRNPHGPGKPQTPLSIHEVKVMLHNYKGTFMSARLHIALICGLRQGEALGLRWSDISFDNAKLEITQQIQKIDNEMVFRNLKTIRSHRSIALTNETLNVLKSHREIIEELRNSKGGNWNDLDLVFPDSDGNPLSSHVDYGNWQRALKLSGVAPRRLHDARHTAATLMYSQGIGIEAISRILGHSTSTITSKLYVHSAIEPLRHAAKKIEDLLQN